MLPVRWPVECLSLTENQRFPSECIDPKKRTQRNPGSLPSLAAKVARFRARSLCLFPRSRSLSRSLSLSFSLFLRSVVSGLHFVWHCVVQLELFMVIWGFEYYYCFFLALKIAFQYAVLKLCFLLLLLYFPVIVVPTLSVSSACRGCRPSGCVDSEVSSGVHV
jgi:hypothetical protein